VWYPGRNNIYLFQHHHHYHHQPINIPSQQPHKEGLCPSGAQAFLMAYTEGECITYLIFYLLIIMAYTAYIIL
jgi:hypothetical protein